MRKRERWGILVSTLCACVKAGGSKRKREREREREREPSGVWNFKSFLSACNG